MEHIRRIQNFEQIKILADPRRLAILRLLMARPYTLSQMGEVLGLHPAKIRHHLKKLEAAGLVELVMTRVVRGFVEKYYQARARAFSLQEIILPDSNVSNTFVALGSHDLALELLAEQLTGPGRSAQVELLTVPVGSLEGLIALRQGAAQMAGCHLLDVESGEYNLPYVRHFFPDRSMTLITLAHREQGLLVAPGNPLRIRKVEDLERQDVRFVNRNKGSGTRLWLDRKLDQLDMAPESVRGYDHEVRTHTRAAERIAQGQADVGLGLRAAAQQHNLDFIPLYQERYDLVLPNEQLENPHLSPLLDRLLSVKFRSIVHDLGGYDTTHTGELLNP